MLQLTSVVCGIVFGVEFRRQTGAVSLAAQQFYAMIIKHAIHTWRNRVITLVQLLLPVLFTLLACAAVLIVPAETDPAPLTLELSHFDNPVVPVTSIEAEQLADRYSDVASKYGKPVTVGGSNMDEYLLDIAKRSLDDYNQQYIVAGTANGSGILVGHFNNFALHSIAMSLSLADNALLRHSVPGNSRIVTVNHPLPRSVQTRTNSAAMEASMTSGLFPLVVSLGLAFLIGSFVVFVVNQRSNKAKHSQFIGGIDAIGYWLAAFVWDLLSFAVSSVLIIIVVLSFRTDVYGEHPVVG